MPAAKVAITLNEPLLREVDRWVAAGEFPNRSRAIQAALMSLRAERQRRTTLLGEIEKLNPAEERALAEERLAGEAPWPV
jgi:Arc/MetJ-type ribon-helix-helix transcriptional regulator